jgi:hypothetical protein
MPEMLGPDLFGPVVSSIMHQYMRFYDLYAGTAFGGFDMLKKPVVRFQVQDDEKIIIDVDTPADVDKMVIDLDDTNADANIKVNTQAGKQREVEADTGAKASLSSLHITHPTTPRPSKKCKSHENVFQIYADIKPFKSRFLGG